MNNNEAIDFLYQLSSLGWKLGLNKIRALLNEINNPHEKYQVVHVAGTNGKGSTSAMLESIFKAASYSTGLFTSPHLINITERIKSNGNEINIDDLIYYINKLRPLIEKYKCTFFEAITAIAFVYFADREVDVAVIEVGLGGRLDATNVVTPVLTIVTDVELDHTKQLGRSRQKIAMEKGGIIKQGATCLTISQHKSVIDTLSQICAERKTELIQVAKLVKVDNVLQNEKLTSFDLRVNGSVYPQLKLRLLGEHQIKNATLAVTAISFLSSGQFKIKIKDIYQGLFDVYWPGRLQILRNSPKLVVDVAHNPDGTLKLCKTIQNIFSYQNLYVLLGICKNKNYLAMIRIICSIADRIIIVKPETHRAVEPEILADAALSFQIPVNKFNNVAEGLSYAVKDASKDDLILGTGSHYTIGEIINFYKNS